jgi:cupin 2 domain-containing protein
VTNLFDNLPSNISEELIEVLLQSKHVRIERIVSSGQASPDDSWYDQSEAEWVVLLRGEGKLLFEDEDEAVHMRPGDHINIRAHRRHRVEWTSPDEPTVWLAVFYRD